MTAADKRSTPPTKSKITWWDEGLPDLVHHQGTKDSFLQMAGGKTTWHCITHLKSNRVSSLVTATVRQSIPWCGKDSEMDGKNLIYLSFPECLINMYNEIFLILITGNGKTQIRPFYSLPFYRCLHLGRPGLWVLFSDQHCPVGNPLSEKDNVGYNVWHQNRNYY